MRWNRWSKTLPTTFSQSIHGKEISLTEAEDLPGSPSPSLTRLDDEGTLHSLVSLSGHLRTSLLCAPISHTAHHMDITGANPLFPCSVLNPQLDFFHDYATSTCRRTATLSI